MMAEIRHHAAPVMLDFQPVSEAVEDHATQAPLVVAKSDAMVELWRHLVAMELLAAAQAVDLRGASGLVPGIEGIYKSVRATVATLPRGPAARW